MKAHERRADGRLPPVPEAVDHQPAVTDRARQAQKAPDGGQRESFHQEQSAEESIRVTGCRQDADFFRPPFDAEAKQKRGEHRRRDDQKHGEEDKEHAEVRTARRCGQPLRLHRQEDQPRLFGMNTFQ